MRFVPIYISIVYLAVCACGCFSGPPIEKKENAETPSYSFQYDTALPREKIAVIVPGMGQKVTKPQYRAIGEYYAKKGITPVYVSVDWKKVGFRDLTHISEEISSALRTSFPSSHLYLFGFSFGAIIAYEVSETIHSDQILLCSLSPLFKEDRQYQIFPFKQIFNLVSDKSLDSLSYLHNKGRCFVFLYGAHDSFLINEAIIEQRKSAFDCSVSMIVKNAGHDVSQKSYLEAIKSIIAGY